MAWTPELNVVDLTPVIDNLLGYIGGNQTDALTWANGGTGLDDMTLYSNAAGRLASQYPQLIVLTQSDEGELESDTLLTTEFRIRLEVAVMGTADELPAKAKTYDLAVRSMLVNIPNATMTAGMKTTTRLWKRDWPATVYDILRGGTGKQANSFLQIFQTEATYIFQTNLV